jgi:hypothetical protein
MNPYVPFNPYKEDVNGKKIFKSPLLKTSKLISFDDLLFRGE